ncbi:ABC transporter substrate-binding protein [Suttonella sp. R2A3]|uniref:ABC transporter substrate-binding protein n=1 Tax=Suttonella sp. R2A3 TaxID=2908648 RepID=UPI001F19D920|nr:ABC transporter substrate-binding protein [Suttonella sp. R2A3]UJF24431.1 ABC transporter substrate-binding protein [Suttonella sp. R2A3]
MFPTIRSLLLGTLASFSIFSYANEPQCDIDRPIVFAGFDWDSITFHNSVARYILEHGYGCATDEIPGSTIPLFNGMSRGNIDIAMEIWLQSVDELWREMEADGIAKTIGINVDDAKQAFFIPRYLVEGENAPAPDLKSVADLPRYAQLFADQEDPDKGRFYNCILGWSCEKTNTAKLYAYGLDKDFVNFRPGSGNAVASAVESAILRQKPILFYYWTPSWLIGKFSDELIILEEPAYDEAIWSNLLAATDKDADLTKVESATAYPDSQLAIGVTTAFAQSAPQTIEFLSRYHTSSEIVSEALADMRNNDTRDEAIAKRFLEKYPDLWIQWVSPEVATRINESL